MTWLRLAAANLGLSPLTTTVNVVLMGLGVASIVLLLLVGTQLADTLSRDARGIDLVLGAKGSPVQLVLSSVYHADVPTGNIKQQDVQRWADDSRVAQAIPLSLGDSYQGFRIVGTTHAYVNLYGAELAAGTLWDERMEVVAGSAVEAAGLDVGDTFNGVHGLQEGGHSHESTAYRVIGTLAPTGTVIDRLILTASESVWELHAAGEQNRGPNSEKDHEHEDEHHGDGSHEHEDEQDHEASEHADREITAMLLQYRSPLAAMSLPRAVNADSGLQAASPATEITRLLQLVGIGFDGLRAFSWVLILTAALSIFAALYGSLRTRKNDLAMLRCLGATRWELLLVLLLEGLLLSGMGVALGFIAGHGITELLGGWLANSRGITLTGGIWLHSESTLLMSLLLVGVIAAAVPAVQAYRTDVARTLAEV